MTRRRRLLWIVDPARSAAEEQGVGELLSYWDGTSRLFLPGLRAHDGPGPATGYDTDGVIVLGSSASVFDEEAWITDLGDWLRPLLVGQRSLPVLGICFGHQLMAQVAGGSVGWVHADRAKIVGVEETRLAGGRLLGGQQALRVVTSHREEVKEVPPGFQVTARRDRVPIDGLEHATLPLFSFQFHPEARDEFARRSGIDPDLVDGRVRADGRRLLQAFLALL
jgi:GMP synthase-like glutamine amidotransferase